MKYVFCHIFRFFAGVVKVVEQRNSIIYSPNSQGSQYDEGHNNSLVA